jgi:hypothetical protein
MRYFGTAQSLRALCFFARHKAKSPHQFWHEDLLYCAAILLEGLKLPKTPVEKIPLLAHSKLPEHTLSGILT